VTEAALEKISRECYDPVYGARPLRRYIQREVESRIGRALLSGDIHDGAVCTIDVVEGSLEVRWTTRGSDVGDQSAAQAAAS
jgi:ATP-dependent Clp protease ATP-binding subunit ClpB